MAGFGNALSFKSITDAEIEAIEDFIKKNAFEYLTKEFCDVSVNNEYEVDINDELLIDYFGPLYAHNTTSFQFRPGDKIRIKEIVNYVKNKVDEGGANKNLIFFANKQLLSQQRRKKNNNAHIHKKMSKVTEFDENELKRKLIEKVVPYFNQTDIDENQCGEMVKLHIGNAGKVYGDIFCAICKMEQRKNKKAKRVYFNCDGKSKGVWVLSNFVKHLETVHKLSVQHKQKPNASKLNANTDAVADHQSSNIKTESDVEKKNEGNDASLIVVDDEELKSKIQLNKNSDTPALLYKQISAQTTKVMTAVYKNGENQSQMAYAVNESRKNLMVATIAKDGNCMLGSAVHQLFCYPLNSKLHKDATKRLRADVVAHILDQKNFSFYLHSLKDRVYEEKNANQITDIEVECKMFVRYTLAQNRFWAGTETLLAISELYETNVIVFNEDGSCDKFKRSGKQYNRSIVVAYRIGGTDENGRPVRNHYDSICEIDSADLYAAVHSTS